MNQTYSSSLYHHGIKGQKWGVRRFQNEDGTLTAAGRRREIRDERKAINKEYRENYRKQYYAGKTYAGHALKAVVGIGASQGIGALLIQKGHSALGQSIAGVGSGYFTGLFIADNINQTLHNRTEKRNNESANK